MPAWEMIQIIFLVDGISSNTIGNICDVKQSLGVYVVDKLTCSTTSV